MTSISHTPRLPRNAQAPPPAVLPFFSVIL
jgi:hypothetical protein